MKPNEPRITLHPHDRRVQVKIGDTLLADTTRAIELRERGYPPRLYPPREDVRMDLLTRSDTVTHCPFKGDASYFSFGDQADVVWSYERPLEGMEAIAGRVRSVTSPTPQSGPWRHGRARSVS